jgi:hypothetical protein
MRSRRAAMSKYKLAQPLCQQALVSGFELRPHSQGFENKKPAARGLTGFLDAKDSLNSCPGGGTPHTLYRDPHPETAYCTYAFR